MKNFIFLLAISFFPLISFSQETEHSFFDTNKNVRKLLMSQGIDVTQVDWVSIEQMCSFLKSESDILENKCKYKNAILDQQFIANKKFCEELSGEMNDKSRSKTRKIKLYSYNEDGDQVSSYYFREEVSDKILKSNINRDYLICMKNYDWVDPKNWKLGKTNINLGLF